MVSWFVMNTDFGTQLKVAIVRRGMKQRHVAAAADISPTYLSDFCNNWRRPTDEQLRRICGVLNISPNELEAQP